jgi:hypothetical protein
LGTESLYLSLYLALPRLSVLGPRQRQCKDEQAAAVSFFFTPEPSSQVVTV